MSENIIPMKPFDSVKDSIPHIPYTEQDWRLLMEAMKRFQRSRIELKEQPDMGFSLGINLEGGECMVIALAKDAPTLHKYIKQIIPQDCKDCQRVLTLECNKCYRFNNLQDLFLQKQKEVDHNDH
jgi:hypothetical protein